MSEDSDRKKAEKSTPFRKVVVTDGSAGVDAMAFRMGVDPNGDTERVLSHKIIFRKPIDEKTAWLLYEALEEVLYLEDDED